MKRISLILLGFILVNTFAAAQLRNFEQRGGATHDLRGDGLVAAHPNLAIGTKVMVVNTVTGKEIEVTITGRIPAAANRIVDLSPGAWQELGLSEGTPVRIYMPPVARPRPAIETTLAAATEELEDPGEPLGEGPADESPLGEGTGDEGPGDMLADAGTDDAIAQISRYFPLNLTVNTYVTAPEETSRSSSYHDGSNTEFLAWLTTMMMDARDARDSREARDLFDIRDARDVRDVRDARDVRDVRDSRDVRDLRDARDSRDVRDTPAAVVMQNPVETVPSVISQPPVQTQPQGSQPAPVTQTPAPAATLPPVVYQEPARQAEPVRQVEPARQVAIPQYTIPGEIQIIPGLPDRFTGKTHDIQIGAFSAPEAAARTIQLARGAGFDVAQEQQGSIRRVIVMGIPAADVYLAIQRLAVMGFNQFWIRD